MGLFRFLFTTRTVAATNDRLAVEFTKVIDANYSRREQMTLVLVSRKARVLA